MRKIKMTRKLAMMVTGAAVCFAAVTGVVYATAPRAGVTFAEADSSTKTSIVNLDGDGGAQSYFVDSLTGMQQEYVYYGANSGSPVMWRVLDTGDNNKYGSGNMLLWADKQLAAETYNSGPNQSSSAQPNYAYWSTSKIRASLNGGQYPNSVTGTNMPNATTGGTITTDDSWYGRLFPTADERDSVVSAGSYTTDNWGIDTSKSQYEYMTSNITANAYGVNGKYNQSILGTGTAASAVKTSDNGVQETSSGDKLFLLDYYDINNTSLGFGDGALTYAKSIDSTWTETSGYYPGYYTGSGKNFNNKTSNYLKFSGEAADYYWLRPAGRSYTSGSSALIVDSSGCLVNGRVSLSYGVRPAFNFNPESVIYATAASVAANGSTFEAVETVAANARNDGKPAYKVYTKASSYVNYNQNSANAPKLSLTTNSVTVTKSGQTGQAVILLADKTDAGKVKYQATASFSGGAATANLPSGVKAGDYAVTVLFIDSVKGGTSSEIVKASFTQSGIVPPEDYTETYSGECLWDEELENDAYSIKSITYTSPAKGATAVDKTDDGTDGIEDAGSYVVKFTLADGQIWTDGTTADKTITITVNQKEIDPFNPTVEYGKNEDNSTKQYFAGTATSGFPTIKPPAAWDGQGTLVWDDKQTLSTTKAYNWTFTPTSLNYAVKKGSSSITVTAIAVNKIEAELGGTGNIYTSTKLDDLLKRITVTKTNNDGTDGGVADVSEIQFAMGTKLEAGTNKELTVQLKSTSVTCKVTIPEILAVEPAELTVEHDGSTVYTSTSADALKGQLTVKIKNNDGSAGKTLEASEYSFPEDFAITDGDFKIEVIYKYTVDGTEKELTGDTTITVGVASVKQVKIKSVTVPSGTKLWEGVAANTIKQYLEIEVTFNDGNDTKKTLDNTKDNYTVTIIGSDKNVLIAGQCNFNVTYGGKTSSPQTVTVTALLVDTLTATYTQIGTIYSSATVDDLQIDTLLSVDATFNNGDNETLDSSEYTVTIPDNFSSTNNTVEVVWKKGDVEKKATFTVTVTDVAIAGMTATYTAPDGKNPTAENALDDLKAGLEVELIYNNGEKKTLKATDYTLEADESELQESGNLNAGSRTVTVKFRDTTATFTVTVDKAEVSVEDTVIKPAADSGLTDDGNGGFKGTYSPEGGFTLGIDPEDLPDGVTPKTPVYKKLKDGGNKDNPSDWEPVSEIKGAGEYIVEIDFEYDGDNFEEISPVSTVVSIAKADVDMDGATVKPTGASSGLKPSANGGYTGTYTPDGDYGIDIDPANVPAGATPKAPAYKKLKEGGNKDNPADWLPVEKIDGAGEYKVVVEFEPTDGDNYNEIDPIEVVLTLSDKAVVSITATSEQNVFTTANTLDELKAKLTATVTYDNGDTESVAVENLEITCEGVSENGKFKSGLHDVSVKYTDEFGNVVSTIVNITVNKVKVELPTFKGGLSYTGASIAPKADNFNGFDAALMSFVADKSLSGLAVGSYKAVFALNDPENYEWATATALKKTVFGAVVYDGEITLLASEAAVDWNISKAVLTATKTDGGLPVFASESFVGAMNEVVAIRYYKDEACTEEVAADQLAKETQYFVKAELLDTENFELDSTAAAYTLKSFSYTTPAKELTTLDKIVNFLKVNWLWLVIAVVALILLIVIIACAVRAAKRKREREERRLAEEKEEKKREQEERREREDERRREEREERMARMSQQQSMPPMMMPQMMPQMMGQMQMPQMMQAPQPQSQPQPQPQYAAPQAQPAAADSAQLARIEAEIAHVMSRIDDKIDKLKSDMKIEKLESAMANGEVATLRNDMNAMRNDMTYAKREEQVVQGGISLDKLTELIRTEVRNAMADEKAAAQPAPAPAPAETVVPAATQVPPDAVMTTVTTTKIDTTKKSAQPAQNAQAAAPVRTVVRNVVAPMPVDDGRVFDVGGFYKPADPITDMGFIDDENKD